MVFLTEREASIANRLQPGADDSSRGGAESRLLQLKTKAVIGSLFRRAAVWKPTDSKLRQPLLREDSQKNQLGFSSCHAP